jgi:ribonuclease P/MRP protein subunit POP1
MPFFSSLTYTGTRVGGQRERQTQSFEAGCAYFPRDYPFTHAYSSYVEQRADQEKDRWERKPPAKRTNFEKLGTRSPWKPDWDVVLGLQAPTSDDLVTTQREEPLTASGKKYTAVGPSRC